MTIQALVWRTDLWKGGAPKEPRWGQPRLKHIFSAAWLHCNKQGFC